MSDILIVADDLSGAADCGIACAVRDSETLLLLDAANSHPDADVLAVDADTRSMTAAGAAAETARLVRSCARPLPRILYKKFDSTLRGHIGVEIAAALAGWRSLAQPNSAIALAAPAFPAMGRTTVGGRQCVHGAPLEADLRCMLETAGLRTGCIGLEIVRGGGLAAVIRENAFAALVCDAETDEDLATIGAAAASFGPGVMWAGSGGLACHLPISARMRPAAAFPSLTRPLLFAVGSAAELSRMQAATLAAIREISTVILTPGTLLAGPGTGEWIEHTALVSTALAGGHDVLVLLSAKIPEADIEGPSLCAALASFLAPLRTAVGALVLTGGETARAVLTAFRVRTLRLLWEVEPGVPLALGLAEGSEPLPVITKAGAFGGRETLVRCRAALRHGKGDWIGRE